MLQPFDGAGEPVEPADDSGFALIGAAMLVGEIGPFIVADLLKVAIAAGLVSLVGVWVRRLIRQQ